MIGRHIPLLFGSVLIGCVPATTAGEGGTTPNSSDRRPFHERYAGTATLRITNATDEPLCEVFLSPATENRWGENWIRGEQIAIGQSRDFGVGSMAFNVKFRSCNQYWAQMQDQAVTPPAEVVFHSGSTPLPPETAGMTRATVEATVVGPRQEYVPTPSGAAGSGGVTLNVSNTCGADVALFISYSGAATSSGRNETLGPNQTRTLTLGTSEALWLFDRMGGNPVVRYEGGPGDVRVGCNGFEGQ